MRGPASCCHGYEDGVIYFQLLPVSFRGPEADNPEGFLHLALETTFVDGFAFSLSNDPRRRFAVTAQIGRRLMAPLQLL